MTKSSFFSNLALTPCFYQRLDHFEESLIDETIQILLNYVNYFLYQLPSLMKQINFFQLHFVNALAYLFDVDSLKVKSLSQFNLSIPEIMMSNNIQLTVNDYFQQKFQSCFQNSNLLQLSIGLKIYYKFVPKIKIEFNLRNHFHLISSKFFHDLNRSIILNSVFCVKYFLHLMYFIQQYDLRHQKILLHFHIQLFPDVKNYFVNFK